ncbi:hypothetical protein MD484_g8687, partial [Candolleomyces efflorescens]
MYKSFGLLTNKRLTYKDENTPPDPSYDRTGDSAYDLLRKSASNLFGGPRSLNNRSVSQNLATSPHPTVILDSPGMTTSLYSTPLSWSVNNQIAVACGRDVYFQDLSTRETTRFFKAGRGQQTLEALSIAWGGHKHETKLACINDFGGWEVFELGSKAPIHKVDGSTFPEIPDAKSLCWNGDLLTLGMTDGGIYFHDIREEERSFNVGGGSDTDTDTFAGHRKSVVSFAWDSSGNYLASGDIDGNVHIWDVRARKALTGVKRSSKIRHQAPVKALSWCHWKSDLLATGSYYPEGIIQVWGTSKLSSGPIEPEKTFSLNSAVHSVIWSPHCKELLSVHGVQFEHAPTTHRQRRSLSLLPSSTSVFRLGSTVQAAGGALNPPATPLLPDHSSSALAKKSKPTIIAGPLTHSIVVHDYPSGKKLFTLSRAHRHSITAACLSPDGRDVFTASPKEQTIKLWKVWGAPPNRVKEPPFESCTIR